MANALTLSGYSSSQIALIRKTVARDTNDDEFNLFFEACRSYGLDPFRKQISAIVFNKSDPKRRQMAIIVSRDGHRVIAQRCGNYRPASEPAVITYDDAMISDDNPKGIVSATVRLWQQDNRGEWFPVIGEAYWDEYCPTEEEWAWSDQDQKRKPTGKRKPSGNWARMPIVMITKCAESAALRSGWPDQFGGIYGEEEVHKAEVDMTAADIVKHEEENTRLQRIGGPSISFTFDDTGVLESVPNGKVADRVSEFLRDATQEEVYVWQIRNTVGLKSFWAMSPGDALDVKKLIESKLKGFDPAGVA